MFNVSNPYEGGVYVKYEAKSVVGQTAKNKKVMISFSVVYLGWR